jgi:hypothetical protein
VGVERFDSSVGCGGGGGGYTATGRGVRLRESSPEVSDVLPVLGICEEVGVLLDGAVDDDDLIPVEAEELQLIGRAVLESAERAALPTRSSADQWLKLRTELQSELQSRAL